MADQKDKKPVIDPEIQKIQDQKIQDMKEARLQQRAAGGPPVPGPQKPMNKLDAIANTVMKNAQDIRQLQTNFQQFASQTEQNVLVTQRMVKNLARPDLILNPVVDQWHESPHKHMILMVKEGMRIVVVGDIDTLHSDKNTIKVVSEQGKISVSTEDVLMIYEKEKGKVYGPPKDEELTPEELEKLKENTKHVEKRKTVGPSSGDSKAPDDSPRKGSKKPKDPVVVTKKG